MTSGSPWRWNRGTTMRRRRLECWNVAPSIIPLFPLPRRLQRPNLCQEKFIVFSALCFASPAACCWCRASCCLFLEMKSFGFDEIQSLQVTPG